VNDHLTREQSARLAALMRDQLNESVAAAHGLGRILGSTEAGREHIAVLNRGLYRQLRLIRHLELLCQLTDQNEIRLHARPVDLVKLCSDLAPQIESILSANGLTFTFRTSLSSLITYADPNLMEEMLLGLLSNSVHAVDERGAIDLSLEARDGRILLLMTDNGGGVSNEALAEFFEYPETEYEEPTKATLKLGLPLIRQIAALHDGFVVADSYAGKGVRLAVLLPVLPCDGMTSLRSPLPEPGDDGWNRVLVELSDYLPAKFYQHEELDS